MTGKYGDMFEEKYDPTDDHEQYRQAMDHQRIRRNQQNKVNKLNEVGEAPPITEEMQKERERYKSDFIALHQEVFEDSTGIKPFGEEQKNSILFGQDIFNGKPGRLLKLEPRGYAKTTRIANEALSAVLLGLQEYIVILCSSVPKAEEILDSIQTELYTNEKLEELFPGPIACFRQIQQNSQKARYQTYGGVRTQMGWSSDSIRFPYVPDEPSSGKFLEIKPINNVKGLFHKIRTGPDAGKVFRPTLYLIDDPQTHAAAKSPAMVNSIIGSIKRDALRGGKHTKRASAIMSITPVCPGDVAYHFEKNEQSWDIVKYKMMSKFPDNHQWWMETYAKTYLNYDRTVRGDRTRASLEAKTLLENNYDMAHEGGEVTWDHAFGWEEEPQTEISAIQHAYNIILDDGMEDFEFECQCNTEYGTYEEGEFIHAPAQQIMSKTLPYKRGQVPQETAKIVCHIDINKDILTYVIMSSPSILRPHIIDYGTYPSQPGLFSKRRILKPLATLYPEITDHRDILYRACKDLIGILAERRYLREDGVELTLNRIGVDIKYEDAYITRAIKESMYRHVVMPCSGVGVGPDDDMLHDKPPADALTVYENCFIAPNKSRTLDILYYDTNYFKTEVHKGFNLNEGLNGSISLFGLANSGEPMVFEAHQQYADQLNMEIPVRKQGPKHRRTRIVWEEKIHQADNEYLDNTVNCMALLITEGITQRLDPSPEMNRQDKKQDMKDFMSTQRNRKLLA